MLTGIAASPGIAEGAVRIVRIAEDMAAFNDGDVLVAEMTEPSMVVMMTKASAIVTDYGGLGAHAAIVSRELGIPCVVGTKTGTSALKEGMRVRVDGSAGTVEEL